MAELEAVMIAREVSKELIKEKFLLVALPSAETPTGE